MSQSIPGADSLTVMRSELPGASSPLIDVRFASNLSPLVARVDDGAVLERHITDVGDGQGIQVDRPGHDVRDERTAFGADARRGESRQVDRGGRNDDHQ